MAQTLTHNSATTTGALDDYVGGLGLDVVEAATEPQTEVRLAGCVNGRPHDSESVVRLTGDGEIEQVCLHDDCPTWELVPTGDDDGPPARGKASDLLLELAGDVDVFHTAEGDPYASVPQGQGRIAVRVDGPQFAQFLGGRYYAAYGRPASSQATSEAVSAVAADAVYGGPEADVHVRVARGGADVYLDLGDETGQAVRVGPDGWEVVGRPPVHFRRPPALRALPVPVKGDPAAALGLVRDHLRVSDDQFALVLAFLVQSIMPEGPYPVLVIQGEQGTGKSVATRRVRSLVDPSGVPIRSAPSSEHDLVLAAENAHVVAFDNMSGVRPELADGLCRLATGGGFGTRRLYSGRDEELFHVQRPVILNGIEALATRPDLGDRSVQVELLPIAKGDRKTEAELDAAFERDHPVILGGLLGAASSALRHADKVDRSDLPRMADFAVNAVAASRVFPSGLPSVLDALRDGRRALVDEAIAASPIGLPIQSLLARTGHWEGQMGQLLTKLRAYLPDPDRPPRGFPRTPQEMAGALKRLLPALRAAGIDREDLPRRGPSGSRSFRLTSKGRPA